MPGTMTRHNRPSTPRRITLTTPLVSNSYGRVTGIARFSPESTKTLHLRCLEIAQPPIASLRLDRGEPAARRVQCQDDQPPHQIHYPQVITEPGWKDLAR